MRCCYCKRLLKGEACFCGRKQPKNYIQKIPKTYDKLTESQKNKLREKHQQKCDICGENPIKSKKLGIDHSHANGIIRGVLCLRCNGILAFAKDDVKILAKAINYLKKNGCETTVKHP